MKVCVSWFVSKFLFGLLMLFFLIGKKKKYIQKETKDRKAAHPANTGCIQREQRPKLKEDSNENLPAQPAS